MVGTHGVRDLGKGHKEMCSRRPQVRGRFFGRVSQSAPGEENIELGHLLTQGQQHRITRVTKRMETLCLVTSPLPCPPLLQPPVAEGGAGRRPGLVKKPAHTLLLRQVSEAPPSLSGGGETLGEERHFQWDESLKFLYLMRLFFSLTRLSF